MTNPSIRPLLLALALPFALAGCSHQTDSSANSNTAHDVQASVLTLSSANLPQTAGFPGSVAAVQQIPVASRIMGYVRAINVEAGESVKQGQLLITVDPTDVQGQVEMSGAGLAQAEAALADAKADYDRFGDLYREEAIPKAQWDKIRLQYTVAQQQVNAARAGHTTAEGQMRYAEIRAPFAGIITQRQTSIGALAAPGQPLLTLVNPAHLEVQTQVPEDVFDTLKTGESVQMHIESTDVTGKIEALVTAADPSTHTHLVKIALPSNQGVSSGMFAQVNFTTGGNSGLRIPDSVIVDRAGISGVFVVDSKNIAHFRMIRKGAASNGQTDITAGLTAGERVVDHPDASLNNGDHVIATGAGNV